MIKKTAFSDMIEQIPSKQSDENLIEESVHVIWIGFKHGIPEVLPSKPFFNRRNVKCYRIADSTHENGRVVIRGIPFEHYDFKRDLKMRLEIRVAVDCPRSNVQKFALAVCKGENPEKSFLKNLESWIKDYTRRIESQFIDQFDAEKEKLKQVIRKKALDEMGLNIDLDMEISGSPNREPPELNDSLVVNMRDYSEEVKIEYRIKTRKLDNSVQSTLDEINTGDLKRSIKEKLEEYFPQSVTIYQLLYESNLLNELITEEISPVLKDKGLSPRKLEIESNLTKPFEVGFFVTYNHSFVCKMTNENRGKVRINQKIILTFQPNQVSNTLRHKLMDQDALENWVKTISENTFTELLMQKEYYEINDFEKIKDTYKKLMENHIKQIGFTALSVPDYELPDEEQNRSFSGLIEVKHKFVDREKYVLIKNKLDLTTDDMSEWMKLKQYNTITEWLEDSLRETFKEVLFSVKYSEYLLNRKHYHEQVKRIMSQKSLKIGYELKHIIVEPEEKLLSLLRSFEINIEDVFRTYDDAKVPLKVNVTLRIDDDLGKVIHLIDSDPHGVIKNRIHDEIRRTALRINAYYFYEKFEPTDDTGESFSSTLKENITTVLIDDFGATKGIEVIVGQDKEKDVVHKRYESLLYKTGTIEFMLKPLFSPEEMLFKVTFEIRAVCGTTEAWRRFIEKKSSFDEIKSELSDHLSALMKVYHRVDKSTEKKVNIYKYYESHHYRELIEYIGLIIKEIGQETFGLDIHVLYLDRGASNREREKIDNHKIAREGLREVIESNAFIKRNELEHKKRLIASLNEQIASLMVTGVESDEEIAEKEQLKAKLIKDLNESANDTELLVDNANEESFEDAIDAIKLLKGGANKKKLIDGSGITNNLNDDDIEIGNLDCLPDGDVDEK